VVAAGLRANASMRRRVTEGASKALPAFAARTAAMRPPRGRVLEQEPAGAGPQGLVDVLVEVEGGDDHDPERVGRTGVGEGPGDLDAVLARHADVDEADVGPELAGEADRLGPVGSLGDHFDVGLVLEDQAQAAADHRLVVGEQNPDAHAFLLAGSGSVAATTQPPSGPGPA
jgi:hypothetical protein